MGQVAIDLPDLEDDALADIVKDNVLAVSALYFAGQLEELKFFAVADKVAEQFETGVVPMSRGPAMVVPVVEVLPEPPAPPK